MLNLFYSLPPTESFLLIVGILAVLGALIAIRDILWPITEDEAFKRLCWGTGAGIAIMVVGLLRMM